MYLTISRSSKCSFCSRYASTVDQRTLRGRPCRLASTSALIAHRSIVILVSISPLYDLRISIVSATNASIDKTFLIETYVEWTWDQLRIMKVGGNESATKYFQRNGGTAALASKDANTKYTSKAATSYKQELKTRAALDAKEYVLHKLFSITLGLQNQLSRGGCDYRCRGYIVHRGHFHSF